MATNNRVINNWLQQVQQYSASDYFKSEAKKMISVLAEMQELSETLDAELQEFPKDAKYTKEWNLKNQKAYFLQELSQKIGASIINDSISTIPNKSEIIEYKEEILKDMVSRDMHKGQDGQGLNANKDLIWNNVKEGNRFLFHIPRTRTLWEKLLETAPQNSVYPASKNNQELK